MRWQAIDEIDKRDDGRTQQRQDLLWAIVRQAFRDAKRGNVMAIEFCFDIALRPSKLNRELNAVLYG